MGSLSRDQTWPALPLESWVDTCRTLHLWTQVVGKVKLRLAPLSNHWWGIVLFVTVSIGVVAAILVDNLSDIPRLQRETDEAIAGGWSSPEPQPLPRQREQPQE